MSDDNARRTTWIAIAITVALLALVAWSCWQRWQILDDTPFPGRVLGTVPDCLARHTKDQGVCDGTPKSWDWQDPLYVAATESPMPGITPIATRRFFCTETICPAVIGTIVGFWVSPQ